MACSSSVIDSVGLSLEENEPHVGIRSGICLSSLTCGLISAILVDLSESSLFPHGPSSTIGRVQWNCSAKIHVCPRLGNRALRTSVSESMQSTREPSACWQGFRACAVFFARCLLVLNLPIVKAVEKLYKNKLADEIGLSNRPSLTYKFYVPKILCMKWLNFRPQCLSLHPPSRVAFKGVAQ